MEPNRVNNCCPQIRSPLSLLRLRPSPHECPEICAMTAQKPPGKSSGRTQNMCTVSDARNANIAISLVPVNHLAGFFRCASCLCAAAIDRAVERQARPWARLAGRNSVPQSLMPVLVRRFVEDARHRSRVRAPTSRADRYSLTRLSPSSHALYCGRLWVTGTPTAEGVGRALGRRGRGWWSIWANKLPTLC